jgi:hypothetical protein
MAFVSFPFRKDGVLQYENMHTIDLGDNCFEIDNSPFYVYGVSCRDIISARRVGSRLLFDRVIKHGGHSTYRVRLPIGQSHGYFAGLWDPLHKLGCSYEGSSAADRRLYSIDIPAGADVVAAYDYLEQNEQNGLWEFEEAHYCPPEGGDPL